jgi:cysteine desulfurase family protein
LEAVIIEVSQLDLMIYLDNAATSYPKPEAVYSAVNETLRHYGGNPGRGGHSLTLAAQRIVAEARLLCAELFHAKSPDCVVFTANATAAINMALKGILKPGDHLLTGSLEHNAVTRPLYRLEQSGVAVTKVPSDIQRGISVETLQQAALSQTKLVVCNHISNVFGTMNDLAAIGSFCRSNGFIFLVDAAQSAGCKSINVQEMGIDLLAFSGHKALFGPQGTGGLYVRSGLQLETLLEGGTGSRSESLTQPIELPDRLESGTPNTPGLAGLAAGIRFVFETGIDQIADKEVRLMQRLHTGLAEVPGIHVLGADHGGSVVSIQFDRYEPEQVAMILDSAFGIAVRSGLHCAADAHRSQNSTGTLRISLNYFNEESDIDAVLNALRHLV